MNKPDFNGPWEAVQIVTGHHQVRNASGAVVATCYSRREAELMAAAPSLHEAALAAKIHYDAIPK